MAEICETCGLPHEICVCEDVDKTETVLEITTEERSFEKEVTIISGFDSNNINLDEFSSELKTKFACGGTYDEDTIELQGNHVDRLKNYLPDEGFNVKF